MASGSSVNSILGTIALILVIAAAAYYLWDQADGNEIEIDLGMQDVPAHVAAVALSPTSQEWLMSAR